MKLFAVSPIGLQSSANDHCVDIQEMVALLFSAFQHSRTFGSHAQQTTIVGQLFDLPLGVQYYLRLLKMAQQCTLPVRGRITKQPVSDPRIRDLAKISLYRGQQFPRIAAIAMEAHGKYRREPSNRAGKINIIK